jgi:lysophospholipase L1-like esterase
MRFGRVLGVALLVVLAASAAGCGQRRVVTAFAIGDSITDSNTGFSPGPGYGEMFEREFAARGLGRAVFRGTPGSLPCDAWVDWIRRYPGATIDYVIIEDYAPHGAGCASESAYKAAFQQLVRAAKAKHAFVIVLDGQHPNLSRVSGIDVLDYPVPPSNLGDGVHYTPAGYHRYADTVCDLVNWLVQLRLLMPW